MVASKDKKETAKEPKKAVVFYGKGRIYDPVRNAIIATFDKSGRLQTKNPKLIERLKADGFSTEPPVLERAIAVPGSKKMRIQRTPLLFPEDLPVDADKQAPIGVGGRKAKRRADEKIRKTGFRGPAYNNKGELKKKRVG